MPSPNIIKLLAPEQIPQPLTNRDVELYKYTKDVYDFLRRLFQNLALILVQVNEGSSDLSVDKWYFVDKNSTEKNYIDRRNWRGRAFYVSAFRPFTTGDPGSRWDGASSPVLQYMVGSIFDDSGAPADWNFTSFTSAGPTGTGNVNLYIEDQTGRIYFTVTGYANVSHAVDDWEFRVRIWAGGEKGEAGDVVI